MLYETVHRVVGVQVDGECLAGKARDGQFLEHALAVACEGCAREAGVGRSAEEGKWKTAEKRTG